MREREQLVFLSELNEVVNPNPKWVGVFIVVQEIIRFGVLSQLSDGPRTKSDGPGQPRMVRHGARTSDEVNS